MSKGCRFVVLGEDESHLRFTKKFLVQRGIATYREVFLLPIPAGRGSGEQHVRLRFPVELKEIRRASQFQRKLLIVLIDGDVSSIAERRRQLGEACVAAGIASPGNTDPICIVVPRRNIQTWVRFLLGNPVDEETDYKKLVSEKDRRSASILLADRCRSDQSLPGAPPSLQAACVEFNRLGL